MEKTLAKKASVFCVALACASLAFSLPALAKNEGKGKSHKEKHNKGKHDSSFIKDHDRDILARYLKENRKSCPPGLAKKRNGCLPPGQAKKFGRGDIIPPSVTLQSLPERILEELLRPPVGTAYARVDDNVYLINESTRKVVEAVTLLSGVR